MIMETKIDDSEVNVCKVFEVAVQVFVGFVVLSVMSGYTSVVSVLSGG